jgi:hypothetical protein
LERRVGAAGGPPSRWRSPPLYATLSSQSQTSQEKVRHIDFLVRAAAKNTDFEQQISQL